MKKIKLNSAQLQLKKDKVAALTNDEMKLMKGGIMDTATCHTVVGCGLSITCYFCYPATALTYVCADVTACPIPTNP